MIVERIMKPEKKKESKVNDKKGSIWFYTFLGHTLPYNGSRTAVLFQPIVERKSLMQGATIAKQKSSKSTATYTGVGHFRSVGSLP